jgi:uncharacterized membrane protein
MATIAGPIGAERHFSIGRVFARAFGTIRNNPLVTLTIALVLGAVPMLVFTMMMPATASSGTTGVLPSPNALIGYGSFVFLGWIGALIMTVLVQAALTRATVADSEGRRATFGECLGAGIKVILPLIGLTLLWWISVSLAFLLLIVPGIILIVMWSTAIPALVEERQGVFAAFTRSAMLTKGERWKVFGLLMVLLVMFWLAMLLIGIVGLSSSRTGVVAPNEAFSLGMVLASIIPSTLFNLAWGTIQPALYIELRGAKDGGDVNALHDVFA